jgi:diguanylate cyclase (GGDEF)-like protein
MQTDKPDAIAIDDMLPGSAHAEQLKRGFPWLTFAQPLETEYRQVALADSLTQVRRNLWIAAVFVIGISWLTHLVLGADVNHQLDLIRVRLLAPVLVFGLFMVYSKWYPLLWPLGSQVGAPLFGAGVAVIGVIAATHGVSLTSTVVLATIFIYFMLGMRFYAALGSALLVLAVYVIAGMMFDLKPGEMLIDSGVLLFANLIGARVCYNLERANRTNFLESHLLTEAASRDGLTGIHNRRAFDEQLDRLWPQAIRDQVPLSLLLIDIDHFKHYNDYYGHQAGDECLRQVARCLMRCARRPLDITTRYGGEEFAIVLYDARREHVEEVARKLHSAIETTGIRHLASPSPRKRLTVSIGAACVMPLAGRSHFGFIQLADEALYAAKEQGRDRLVVMDKEYEQLNTGAFRRSAAGGNRA